MNLRLYYQQIREIRSQINGSTAVIISHATSDGGVEGAATEVTADHAAQMLADKRARLATDDEATAFRRLKLAAHQEAKEREAAGRIQVTVVNAENLRPSRTRGNKDAEQS